MPSALCFWVSVKGAWSSWRAQSRGSRRSWCRPRRRWTQHGCRGTSWRARGRVCTVPWPGCAPSRPAPPPPHQPGLTGHPPAPASVVSPRHPTLPCPPRPQPEGGLLGPRPVCPGPSPECWPSCSWGTLPGLPACLPWLQPWTQGPPSTPGASPLQDHFQAPRSSSLHASMMRSSLPTPLQLPQI